VRLFRQPVNEGDRSQRSADNRKTNPGWSGQRWKPITTRA